MKTEIYELEAHSYGGLTTYRVGEDLVEKIEFIGIETTTEYKIVYKDGYITCLRGNFNYIERHRETKSE